MHVLAKYVYFIFILETSGKDGVCYEDKIVNGVTVLAEKCCHDYHKSPEGVCSECPIGFYGENCLYKCTIPFFGRLCTNRCYCESFSLSSEQRKATLKERQLVISEETTIRWDNDVSSIKHEREPNDAVATLKQVIIITAVSSACTTVFLIMIFIFTLITKRFLCKQQRVGREVISIEAISTGSETNDQQSVFQEQSIVIQRNHIPDSQYETIDELNMIENSNIITSQEESDERNTHISNSSGDSKTSNASEFVSEDTEGYLHPYNTLVENWQNKGYKYSPCTVKTDKQDTSSLFLKTNGNQWE
ncbi:uncharacterized protein [Mytilus edulis]|uniref:uncharacterized protein isoform X2 n=1 Tax=Mytilus edulis TaxID=6550 RepID=UPI0039F08C86